MPTYTIQDTETGKQITFDWADPTPPTDDDFNQVIDEARASAPASVEAAASTPPTIEPAIKGAVDSLHTVFNPLDKPAEIAKTNAIDLNPVFTPKPRPEKLSEIRSPLPKAPTEPVGNIFSEIQRLPLTMQENALKKALGEMNLDIELSQVADNIATVGFNSKDEALKVKARQDFIITRAPMLATVMTAPLALATFEGLQQFKNYAVSRKLKEPYNPLSNRMLAELLPPETNPIIKTGVSVGEMVGDVAFVGTALNLASKGLLNKTIKTVSDTIGAKYGPEQGQAFKATMDAAVANGNLKAQAPESEIARLIKAKKLDITDRLPFEDKSIVPYEAPKGWKEEPTGPAKHEPIVTPPPPEGAPKEAPEPVVTQPSKEAAPEQKFDIEKATIADLDNRNDNAYQKFIDEVQTPTEKKIADINQKLSSMKGTRGAAKQELLKKLKFHKDTISNAETQLEVNNYSFASGILDKAIEEARNQGLILGEKPQKIEEGNITPGWEEFAGDLSDKLFEQRGYREIGDNYHRPIKSIIQETIDEYKNKFPEKVVKPTPDNGPAGVRKWLEPQKMFVEYDGKKYPVSSHKEASEKFDKYITAIDTQFSGDTTKDISSSARILDNSGKQIATISRNGKVWDNNGKLIYGEKYVPSFNKPEVVNAPVEVSEGALKSALHKLSIWHPQSGGGVAMTLRPNALTRTEYQSLASHLLSLNDKDNQLLRGAVVKSYGGSRDLVFGVIHGHKIWNKQYLVMDATPGQPAEHLRGTFRLHSTTHGKSDILGYVNIKDVGFSKTGELQLPPMTKDNPNILSESKSEQPQLPQPPAVKEPWQMNNSEWAHKITELSYSDKVDPRFQKSDGTIIPHEDLLKQALSEGRQVPTEVLKDYPKLQPEIFNKGKLTPYDTVNTIKTRELAKTLPDTFEIKTPERDLYRKNEANIFYGDGAATKENRIDIVIGLPASGKSLHIAKPLAKKHGSIIIDNDLEKIRIPEFSPEGLQKGIGAAAVHRESSYIVDNLVFEKAVDNNDNIVWPRIGKNLNVLQEKIEKLKKVGYSVHIHYVEISPEEAMKRAVERWDNPPHGTINGFVDPAYIQSLGLTITDNYAKLIVGKGVDSYGKWNNEVTRGTPPELVAEQSSANYEKPTETRIDRSGRDSNGKRRESVGQDIETPGVRKVGGESNVSEAGQVGGAETRENAGPIERPGGNEGGVGRGNAPSGHEQPVQPGSYGEPSTSSIGSLLPRERVQAEVSEVDKPQELATGNYKITDADQIGVGTPKSKYALNLKAIKLLKQIENEKRLATPEEQAVLVKYVGWGGLSDAFSSYGKWPKEYAELKEILSDAEFEAARKSTISAYYTDKKVIEFMWNAVKQMGFSGGKALEPGAGVGHFLGLRPEGMKIGFTAIELDDLTGRIAKQLYQNSDVHVAGFQDVNLPKDFYNLSISNVPFADIRPFDPRAKALGIPEHLLLHDYFFAKSLALTKPGGLVAFITSKGTMDKQEAGLRNFIARQADLVAAIRLPSTAFKANAGTQVVADILFLRKRLPGETPAGMKWTNSIPAKISNRNVFVNEYFVANPQMVLGDMKVGRGQYTENELTVDPFDVPLDESLKPVLDKLPKDLIVNKIDTSGKKEAAAPALTREEIINKKLGSYVEKDDKIYQVTPEGPVLQEYPEASDKNRMSGMMKIRDALKGYIDKQINDDKPAIIEASRAKLNTLYDAFVKKYGYLNSSKNSGLFEADMDATRIAALETHNNLTKQFEKAAIFTERTIKPHIRPTTAKDAKEAIFVSLGEYGKLDWKYMAEITGKPAADLQADLTAQGLIYKNPVGEKVELTEEYLSGNVKQKLREAEAAAKLEPSYKRNVEALKKIIPADIPYDQIDFKFGAPWIDKVDYQKFMGELINADPDNIGIVYNPFGGSWSFDAGYEKYNHLNTRQYGTDKISAIDILETIANSRDVRITKKIGEGENEKRVIDEEATALANAKADILREKFHDWFWKDIDRREKYIRVYNDKYNTNVEREYNGDHLVLPGLSDYFKLRKSQSDAIWRAIANNSTYLAHAVGAGKTLIMTAVAMESKRLGLINKPLIVVLKNTLPVWKMEFNKAYPNANVLIADEKNFTGNKRRLFLSRVATGNYDAIIISGSANTKIAVSDQRYIEYINRQLDDMRNFKESLKGESGGRYTIKQMEKTIAHLEEKLKARLDKTVKDDTVKFEELGVDSIFVDEADIYKNLRINTSMGSNIRGMGSLTGNNLTEDMMMKLDIIRERGGKIVFASGTPISNSMTELHGVMKYLIPEQLKERGLENFDDWARTFGQIQHTLEIDAAGRYKNTARFSKFVNVPELMQIVRGFMDIQTREMLMEAGILKRGVNLPAIEGGKPSVMVGEVIPELKHFIVNVLAPRADALKGRRVEKGGDNMLTILHAGIMGSIDMRLIDPSIPANPQSKIELAISDIYDIYKKHDNIKGAQLIFIDRVAPKKEAAFNPQWYLKRALIQKGIPEKQIAFIQDFNKLEEKEELYRKVNAGEVRVLFGSTSKLGAGTNVQERLVAVHRIDIPFRPRDIEQSEGRIDRPGNLSGVPIVIRRWTTKGGLDTFMWQMLEAKDKSIKQIFSKNSTLRTVEDDLNEYEILKAASSDNPLLKEKADVDMQVKKLATLRSAFEKEKYESQARVRNIPDQIANTEDQIENFKAFIENRPEKVENKKFSITLGDKVFTDKTKAWKYLVEESLRLRNRAQTEESPVGEYEGYSLAVRNTAIGSELLLESHGAEAVAHLSESPDGTIASMDWAINKYPENKIKELEARVKSLQDDLKVAEQMQESGFTREEDYQQSLTKQKELQGKILEEIKKSAGLDKKLEEINSEIAAEIPDKKVPVGMSIDTSARSPDDNVNLPKGAKIVFDNPDLERAWQAAKGLTKDNIWNKVREYGLSFWHRATRSYELIPNTPEYAEFRRILNAQANNKNVAAEQALRLIQGITLKLGKNKFDIFNRKVVLDDLAWDAKTGKDLPLGLDTATLAAEKERIDELVKLNPDVEEAIRKRKEIQATLTEDLVMYDIIDKETAQNPDYFHHQVLEYANLRAVTGVGKSLKTPNPGFAKHRKGTILAINTDYLQAEFEYMAQAIHDIRTMQNIDNIFRSKYNITRQVKDDYIHRLENLLEELEGNAKNVREMRERIKGGPKLERALRARIGAIDAEALEKHDLLNWRKFIPATHELWQVKKGTMFYTAKSIPEKVLDKLLDGVLPVNMAKQYLASTKDIKECVLPKEIVATLDNLYTVPPQHAISKLIAIPTRLWKQYILFNPHRLLMYNWQNMLGDFDALMAANPTAVKYVSKALNELYQHFYNNRPMTDEMAGLFERGGFSSGITVQELPELREISLFNRLYDEATSLSDRVNVVKKWFRMAGKMSTFRENLLRYALYLDYLDRFKRNDFGNMWVLKYGASNPKEIDELQAPEDKAAKVATEAIGDYANVSILTKEARTTIAPFLSWLEINFKRYPNLLANAYREGKGPAAAARMGVGAAARIASSVILFALRAAFLWGLYQIWNNLFHGAEEDELDDYTRRRMHLIVGRSKNGDPIILKGQGALSDAFEWIGLNELPRLAQLLAEGKIDVPYLVMNTVKAPFNKLLGTISPFYKGFFEATAGVTYFPDVLNPRQVRDPWRNMAMNVQLEDVYDWLTGKPQKPALDIMEKFTPVKTRGAEENAYQDIQNLKRLYFEKKGEGKFSSSFFSPKAEAAYYLRQAMKYGDEKAKAKYLAELKALGVRGGEFRRMIKYMNPLSGMSLKEKREFVGTFLDYKDRERLKKAMKYYKSVLADNTAEEGE